MEVSMPRRFSLLVVIAALACACPSLLHAQRGSLYMCSFRTGLPRSPRASIYTTEILPMKAAYADITRAWTDYVKAKIDPNVGGSAECYSGDQPSIGQTRASQLEIWGAGKHIDTGWEYSAGMTATPSKPGAVYAWCNSGTFAGEKTVYDTPVFEISMGDARSTTSPAENAFAKYLISKGVNKYPFQQWYSMSVGCPHSYDSRTIAEEARAKAESQWRGLGKSVVQTAWSLPFNANAPVPRNSH
jgi:hypothetical protein